MINNTIFYVDGPCGSGKSHQLINYTKQTIIDQKSIIATPTILLANQYQDNFTGTKQVSVIHSDNSENVKKTLINKVHEVNRMTHGHCIVMTQNSWNNFPTSVIANPQDWEITLDEVPNVHKFYGLCLPHNYKMFTNMVDLGQQYLNTNVYKLQIKDLQLATVFAKRVHDDVDAVVKPIIIDLLNGYDVFVDSVSWNQVFVENIIESDENYHALGAQHDKNKVFFLSVLKPDELLNFKQARIMGANFANSSLNHLWSLIYGIDFVKDKLLTAKLRNDTHTNGDRLVIKVLQEKKWSKKQAEKIDASGRKVIDTYIDQADDFFKTNNVNDVLGVFNVCNEKKCPQNWKILPVVSHGMNSYQKYNGIFISPAINLEPQHYKMLNEMGINPSIIDAGLSHENTYQNLLRTCIRDPNSNEKVYVVVPDLATSNFIANLFPGCTVESNGIKKQAKPVSRTCLQRTFRFKQELSKFIKKKQVLEISAYDVFGECSGNVLYTENHYKKPFHAINVEFFNSVKSNQAEHEELMSVAEFADLFEKGVKSAPVINDKRDNALYSMVNHEGRTRKIENSVNVGAVVLDIDGGDLPPNEFHRIFTEEFQTSHLLHHTTRHLLDGQNRYRAILFADLTMNMPTYYKVFDFFVELLSQHGYETVPQGTSLEVFRENNPGVKISGIDLSKRNPSSIFYLPANLKGNEHNAFFMSSFTSDKDSNMLIDTKFIAALANACAEPAKTVELVETQATTSVSNIAGPVPIPQKQLDRVENIINSMVDGNRSYAACQLAGLISVWNWTYAQKTVILNKIIARGCDVNAVKSFKKYARLSC